MSVPPVGAPGIPMRLPIGLDGGVRLDQPMEGPQGLDAAGKPNATNPFERLLMSTIDSANNKLVNAEQAAADFASGKSDDIHGTMIAVTQADIQLKLVGSMRNRIIDAFNEIWRMQV